MDRISSSRSSKAYCALQGPHGGSLQTAQLAKTGRGTLHLQGQAGRGSEQPDLVESVPAHGRQVEQMIFKALSNPNPSIISACPPASSSRGHLLPSEDIDEKN